MSINEKQQPAMSVLIRWMMWICCALMIVPIAIFLVGGGSVSDAGGLLRALLPLALCVGMHFLLHRFFGVNCHPTSESAEEQKGSEIVQSAADVSAIADRRN